MGAGKILCIIGGIVTLISTFFFSLFSSVFPAPLTYIESGTVYGNGLTFFVHMLDMFTNADGISTAWSIAAGVTIEPFMIYIVAVILLIFSISGVLILIGVKSRAVAIIGSILPLFIGIIILLGSFIALPEFLNGFSLFMIDGALVDGIIPFDFGLTLPYDLHPLIPGEVSIGTITLIVGGVLGLVGGILGPDEF
ncbi:MAG: hypothetical protein JSV62_07590 [Promethearchaeota archaeon]|nr:MAG: hypothetical protein JSV62_07590 [Candidatus Lokiarchaeota archaeon]